MPRVSAACKTHTLCVGVVVLTEEREIYANLIQRNSGARTLRHERDLTRGRKMIADGVDQMLRLLPTKQHSYPSQARMQKGNYQISLRRSWLNVKSSCGCELYSRARIRIGHRNRRLHCCPHLGEMSDKIVNFVRVEFNADSRLSRKLDAQTSRVAV
jgi:hypothetical protein